MIFRLGYVSIALNHEEKITTSSTVTFKNYSKIEDKNQKLNKLKSTALSNLDALVKILNYNIENEIHFYRITSGLIPLVTHPDVGYWGHKEIFKKDFEYIGHIIRDSKMRVDTHPDQFNVINSTNDEVVKNTERNLLEHVSFYEDINYDDGMMVIHVGGGVGGKEQAIERFIKNFNKMPSEIRNRLMIENDDKIFTAKDVLNLCEYLNIPMVLDIHHHYCNNDDNNIFEIIPRIFSTFDKCRVIPKIHVSSPLDEKNIRKHHDFIDAYTFIKFIEGVSNVEKKTNHKYDFDVMVEAKKKDIAMMKLADDIGNLMHENARLDKTTFKV